MLAPDFNVRRLAVKEREAIPPWIALLGRFYRRAHLPFPEVERLQGSEMPEPYRKLLVHSNDMTPTLEGYYRQPLSLTVISRERKESVYLREVTLNLSKTSQPVEYGAIQIYLESFPTPARQEILREQTPLGKILETEAIAHVGWPQAFFRLRADRHVSEHLRVEGDRELYGRRNVLLDGQRRMLAEVIEVLSPAS